MANPCIQVSSTPLFLLLLLFLLSPSQTTSSSRDLVIIRGNSTLQSPDKTYELGFFNPDGKSTNWYVGIWYASFPNRIPVWVANREKPFTTFTPSTTLQYNHTTGKLEIIDPSSPAVNPVVIWQKLPTDSHNVSEYDLTDTGNFVLMSNWVYAWQSFDFPTDTWLPGMKITGERLLISWKSASDPSPGMFSLRLNPWQYNEFELVFNRSIRYWSTGTWTGDSFADVPEMTIPNTFSYYFVHPYTDTASLWYTESKAVATTRQLTRFQLEPHGQLKQYTWTNQSGSWRVFWSQPDNLCEVYGLCGNLGICNGSSLVNPCDCVSGFRPFRRENWDAGDSSGGCVREGGDSCDANDGFMEVGAMSVDGLSTTLLSPVNRSFCESSCLSNCSCVGLVYNERSSFCRNFHGPLLNLRDMSYMSSYKDLLYLRVKKEGVGKNIVVRKPMVWVVGIVGSVVLLVLVGVVIWVVICRRIKKRKRMEEERRLLPALNLKLFTYEELEAATRGFSVKLGSGGFGTVFQGELPDETIVAVKRLDKPNSGEKEFRAEVCTIGNVQHINLMRLRGFCTEKSQRLLVYDYMPNGALSSYICRTGPCLSWEVRFRIAIDTAKGLAYLHEECRECIIHCDIKPENILLDTNYKAKVSDFGLAKLVRHDFSIAELSYRGTNGYVAPEWISGVPVTPKVDVYSYGMTLFELLRGRRNTDAPRFVTGPDGRPRRLGSEGRENYCFPLHAAKRISEGGDVAALVDERLGDAYKIKEAERMALVAVWCIQESEGSRPTMGKVVKMLEGMVEISIPPQPKLLQGLMSSQSYYGSQVDSWSSVSKSDDDGSSDENQQRLSIISW
ncbi:hypothetical protein Tsubulata_043736 [Turnera subulata]|uniref:Receptor-like serine/threonine-protein kinase n=1 Tax=Turnera subulata TaxID=218843 RepID=A0A9Q0FVQ0_9ROSI|nr:hypothetical protein Tsubulata_043736 [Turnera subulata]